MIMSNIAEIIYRARSRYSFAELRNGPTCKIASVSGGDFDGPAPRRYYRLLQFNVEHRGAHRSIHRLSATRCKRFPASRQVALPEWSWQAMPVRGSGIMFCRRTRQLVTTVANKVKNETPPNLSPPQCGF